MVNFSLKGQGQGHFATSTMSTMTRLTISLESGVISLMKLINWSHHNWGACNVHHHGTNWQLQPV